jgi:hypothetical protein
MLSTDEIGSGRGDSAAVLVAADVVGFAFSSTAE